MKAVVKESLEDPQDAVRSHKTRLLRLASMSQRWTSKSIRRQRPRGHAQGRMQNAPSRTRRKRVHHVLQSRVLRCGRVDAGERRHPKMVRQERPGRGHARPPSQWASHGDRCGRRRRMIEQHWLLLCYLLMLLLHQHHRARFHHHRRPCRSWL